MDDGLEIEADICVVGAGAAGITMTKLLGGSSLKICLLESGGLEYEDDTQQLYDGESTGMPWYDARSYESHEDQEASELLFSRLRFFGGTTNHWGGGCQQLDETDFRQRDWIPYSGWPIDKVELLPFYARARQLLQLTPDPSAGPERFQGAIPFDRNFFSYYRSALALPEEPTRFGPAYRSDIERAKNVTALLHANLVEFKVNEMASNVSHAEFRSLEGKRGTVRARAYVLACGGIENARLLLLSNSVAAGGLGNKNDLVGRFFMDHPRGVCGAIAINESERLMSAASLKFGEIRIGEPLQRRERILQGRTRLIDREDGIIPDGILAARELKEALSNRTMPDHLADIISRIASDLDDVGPGIYRKLTGQNVMAAHHFDVECAFEQAPNPKSRITLGDSVDALGQRKVQLDWQLTELDRLTYRTMALRFAEEIGRLNFGRMRLAPWLDADSISSTPQVGGASHHMGTTRMADDPKSGVVDRNGLVHGMKNLFVAGSSCFPTSSWALPTWTIVAMAIRLQDHLRVCPESL